MSTNFIEVKYLLSTVLNIPKWGPEEEEKIREWTLAHPISNISFQKGEYPTICANIMQQLKENLVAGREGKTRIPVVFGTMGCIGIGKSRLCDELRCLLLPGQDSVLLKVTYSFSSSSSSSSSSSQQINPSTPITKNHLKQTKNITNQPNFQH